MSEVRGVAVFPGMIQSCVVIVRPNSSLQVLTRANVWSWISRGNFVIGTLRAEGSMMVVKTMSMLMCGYCSKSTLTRGCSKSVLMCGCSKSVLVCGRCSESMLMRGYRSRSIQRRGRRVEQCIQEAQAQDPVQICVCVNRIRQTKHHTPGRIGSSTAWRSSASYKARTRRSRSKWLPRRRRRRPR